MFNNKINLPFSGLIDKFFFIYLSSQIIIINLVYCQDIRFLIQHPKSVINICYSPDGAMLASVCSDKNIRLWDTVTGRLIKNLYDNIHGEINIQFSPDNKFLCSGGWDNVVKIWDIRKARVIRRLNGHKKAVRSVCYYPGGEIIASAGWDNEIKLWYAYNGININTIRAHTQCIRSIVFSPDGIHLASAGYDKIIKIWNIYTGELELKINAHRYPIECLAYSRDGLYLASASIDNTVKLWDTKTGKLIKIFKGHKGSVLSVNISPDNNFLATGSNDKTVKVWNISTGKCIYTLSKHTYPVKSVCFSPDGKSLASAAVDNYVIIWNIENLNISPFHQKYQHNLIKTVANSDKFKIIFPYSDYSEYYERNFTLKLVLNTTKLTNYKLYINKKQYCEFNGIDTIIVQPEINTIENFVYLDYDIYLRPGDNIIEVSAQDDSNKTIYFSKPINIYYTDLYKQRYFRNLHLVSINVPHFKDKKLNNGYTNFISDTLLNILQTQEGIIYKTVNIYNLKTYEQTKSERINQFIDSLAMQIKKNDILVIYLSTRILKDVMNTYYILSSDVDKTNVMNKGIEINYFLKRLAAKPNYLGIFIDLSSKLNKRIRQLTDVNAESLLAKLEDLIEQKNSFVIIYESIQQGKMCDIICNSLNKNNDIDKNKTISFKEIIVNFKGTEGRTVYRYTGKDIPLYMSEEISLYE